MPSPENASRGAGGTSSTATSASSPSASSPPALDRLVSIDALRGFDMFWIMGGDRVARALGRWLDSPAGAMIDYQFEHAKWDGFRFYDLIFPLFLFVVGTVVPFSLRKHRGGSHPKSAVIGRIARRVALLFLLGLLLNGLLRFDFQELRVAGVLQRIAICYGAASLLYLAMGTRARAILVALILVGYWGLLMFVPAPETGKAGDLSIETNLGGYLDRHYLPGDIKDAYYGFGDNECLLSTIPAIATALLGVLAGEWLMSNNAPWRKVGGLLVAGGLCLSAGFLWALHFPIIKNLWTSSFVLVAGGLSLLLLALFYAVIDVLRFRAWAFFFVVIGMNAITIYCLPAVFDFGHTANFFFGGLIKHSGSLQPILAAVSVLLIKWLVLLFLYRKRVFLRV